METQNPANEPEGHWKSKYLNALDRFEAQENQANQQFELLRRGLVRVSLAADGLDPELDKQLEQLRKLLRDRKSNSDFAQLIDQLEASILNLEKQKQNRAQKTQFAAHELIEQLLQLPAPKSNLRNLKNLKRDINKREQQLSDWPNLIQQLQPAMSAAVKRLKESNHQKGDGFWQQLFGKTDSEPAVEHETNNEHSPVDTDLACEEDTAAATEQTNSPALSPASDPPPVAEEKPEPPQAASDNQLVSDKLSVLWRNLLRNLEIPNVAKNYAKSANKRLDNDLQWYELVPTMEDLSQVVLLTHSENKRDFTNYLANLNKRLDEVQAQLLQAEGNNLETSHELDQSVRNQVRSIGLSVEKAENINDLKDHIGDRLEDILCSMDEFKRKSTESQGSLTKQLQTLINRVESMEEESRKTQKRLEEERRKALLDALTQLPNREAYLERLQIEVARWRRYQSPLSLVIGDIDLFKRINDNWGHLAGDQVLKVIAKTISKRLRETDFVGRFGGEEFVLLLPETTAEQAQTTMEMVREAVSKLPFSFRSKPVQVTISFGVSEFAEDDTNEQVFERADAALYAAKKAGRNNCQIQLKSDSGPATSNSDA